MLTAQNLDLNLNIFTKLSVQITQQPDQTDTDRQSLNFVNIQALMIYVLYCLLSTKIIMSYLLRITLLGSVQSLIYALSQTSKLDFTIWQVINYYPKLIWPPYLTAKGILGRKQSEHLLQFMGRPIIWICQDCYYSFFGQFTFVSNPWCQIHTQGHQNKLSYCTNKEYQNCNYLKQYKIFL